MADSTENWLYDEGEDCKKNEYVEKLQQLQVDLNNAQL
jgi:heat shock protein